MPHKKTQCAKKRPSADRTREMILAAARKLFVQQGFAATSISQIAKAAHVTNQSLIYHHFSNKVELWKQIKQSMVAQHLPAIHQRLQQVKTANDFIEIFIKTTVQVFCECPDLKRMADWQYLEPDSLKISGLSMGSIDEVWLLLKSFQQAGALRSDLDAVEISQLLVSLSNTAVQIPPGPLRDDVFAELLAGAKRILLVKTSV